ncbi:MAG: Hint domain-containing protein, partial [Pseudomonadota bacterium]
TFYLADGSRVFTPTDGQVLQNGTFQSSTFVNGQGPLNVPGDLGPTCFTPGVLIDTPEGTRAVETLEPGDPVLTVDHGVQRLRDVLSTQTRGIGVFAPVRITEGALGNTRDLIVSQQHRILLTGWKAQLYCGEDEVLVAARHLVNADTIHIMPQAQVTYIHLLFDRHELVMSEGIATESYFGAAPVRPGAEGTAAELCALFPHASAKGGTSPRTLARPALKHHESGLMLA